MRRYRTLSAVVVLIVLWELLALRINNDWLMPYPVDVVRLMLQQLTSSIFFTSVLATLSRVVLGLLMAFIIALCTSFLSYRNRMFEDLFYPILVLTRSVPNISYIIIILLWAGSESSSAIITFLILFPMIHATLYQGFLHLDHDLLNVIKIYPTTKGYSLFHIYLPMMKASLLSSLSNGISLGFKVGVMSEIIGQVQIGIGRQLNLCRLNYDMNGIFAWTGWIIILLLLFEGCCRYLITERIKHSSIQ